MNKLTFALCALFAVSSAQKESKGDTCLYDALDIFNERSICLADKGDPQTINPERCPCFNDSTTFYNEHVDCRYSSDQLRGYYESYLKLCHYNECNNCISGEGSDTCENEITTIASRLATCLADKGDPQTVNPERCPCFNESAAFYNEYPDCKDDSDELKAYYESYLTMCNYNQCGNCGGSGGEGSDMCESKAQAIADARTSCFLEKGTTADPDPAKCPCFNESAAFYNEHTDCRDGSADLKAYYDSYLTMCNYNQCEGCVSAGFSVVPAIVSMIAIVALLF